MVCDTLRRIRRCIASLQFFLDDECCFRQCAGQYPLNRAERPYGIAIGLGVLSWQEIPRRTSLGARITAPSGGVVTRSRFAPTVI